MKVLKILTRFYVHDLDQAIKFYETICATKCLSRFPYPEINLELAFVGDILLICGTAEALQPFRDTQATFLVDALPEYREYLLSHGATIIRDLKEVPTGINMTVKHADGVIIEYVEHRNKSLATGSETK